MTKLQDLLILPEQHLTKDAFTNISPVDMKNNRMHFDKRLECYDYKTIKPQSLRSFTSPQDLPPPHERFTWTLVLDLDETLICVPSGASATAAVIYVRPFAREFLRFLHTQLISLEVIVWSAGVQEHVERVCEILDPLKIFFHHVICRGVRWCDTNPMVKNLSLLPNRPRSILLDDNCVHSILNPWATIIISGFNPKDTLAYTDTSLLFSVQLIARTHVLTNQLLRGREEALAVGISTGYLDKNTRSPLPVSPSLLDASFNCCDHPQCLLGRSPLPTKDIVEKTFLGKTKTDDGSILLQQPMIDPLLITTMSRLAGKCHCFEYPPEYHPARFLITHPFVIKSKEKIYRKISSSNSISISSSSVVILKLNISDSEQTANRVSLFSAYIRYERKLEDAKIKEKEELPGPPSIFDIDLKYVDQFSRPVLVVV